MSYEKHSKFSPSKRERWANCPGSIQMEDIYPNETSDAAAEGIESHALLESLIRNNGVVEKRFLDNDSISVPDVLGAYRHVSCLINELLAQGMRVQVKLEQRVSITEKVYGTADIIIIAERYGHKQWLLERLYVIDYKNGRLKVEAKDNKQLEFYAVAAYVEMEEDIQFSPTCELHFWILQPKISHAPSMWIIYDGVNDWLVDTYDKIMNEVHIAEYLNVALSAGTWCMYCKASGICPTYAEYIEQKVKKFLGFSL